MAPCSGLFSCFGRSRSRHTKSYMDPNQERLSPSEQCRQTKIYRDVAEHQWPIVYSPEYNLSVMGMEKLHPFDAGKWGKVYEKLKKQGMIGDDTVVEPIEASEADLLVVHTPRYLESLTSSVVVARITEVPPAAMLPNSVLQQKFLRPMRMQTAGTILAGKLALERKWAINIGGGFHHCSADNGGGFCPYADITLCLHFLFHRDLIKKALIIDLDAHQGNGHERDFMNDDRVYILDIYNEWIYPHDSTAKRAIKRKVELSSGTADEEYLDKVRRHVAGAMNEFPANIIIYNAGTDILIGDPLGAMNITPEGIITRDQIVFEEAVAHSIPIVMVTSGGYQKQTGPIIADSILNLYRRKLIQWDPAEAFEKQHGRSVDKSEL
ncbi:histone deacetylase 11-like [Paramacrobiotus metropolitanus]|uniref:histone deacetylase 11-like n=1 Tax=Paramacrobiotus metropolitanus TaxID=2943436 RepID=UPI0024464FB1|nr:histone deacetylase 11-like [Paramacrobiotus metropolitanus]